jgi:hypothetical protein
VPIPHVAELDFGRRRRQGGIDAAIQEILRGSHAYEYWRAGGGVARGILSLDSTEAVGRWFFRSSLNLPIQNNIEELLELLLCLQIVFGNVNIQSDPI